MRNTAQQSYISFLLNSLNKFLSPKLTNTMSFSSYFEPIISMLLRSNFRANLTSTKVKSIEYIDKELYTVTLKVESSKPYEFKPGQFIQIEIEIDGRRYIRSFSLSSTPEQSLIDKEIQLTIKEQDQGRVTPYLRKASRIGARINVSKAMGEFGLSQTLCPKLFIAGGSGISPILSMLKSLPTAANSQYHLLYFQRGSISNALSNIFDFLRAKGISVTTYNTRNEGHFNKALLQSINIDPTKLEAYICGPGQMINSCTEVLAEENVPLNRIFKEYFGSTTVDTQALQSAAEHIRLEFSKSRKTLQLGDQNRDKSLLDIAEQAGLKPLSGCRIGVCHQCVCKKKSGQIYNIKTKKLSDTAAEEIQMCQSIPVSDLVLDS